MKFIFISFIFITLPLFAADKKPKYGSEAILLSHSHQYVQKYKAPDYWAISPYYTAQQDDRSCSVAAMTMIINAARVNQKLTADEELVTQQNLLKKVDSPVWSHGVGPMGHGITLDQLKEITEQSLKAYGFKNFNVQAIHLNELNAKTKKQLHQDLIENEKSDKNFIIANFIQGFFTGDTDVGHFAPVAAYDAKNKKVLIMDPDRQWYEPYWVSEEVFAKAMATKDKEAEKYRGYLFIKIN